jgi:hydrogenase expression/formation protein HypE
VSPIFFPGGDIGRLAVNGTVNDLAMCGAAPLHLSVAFILEEGLPMDDFRRVLRSMREAADAAGVTLVTGDTKVVDRGKADGIFINTAGIGLVPEGAGIDPRSARPGDRILLSGAIAEHGMAILSVREGLEFETVIASDTAPLNGLVRAILDASGAHVLRDPTRGGLSAALCEIAHSSGVGIHIDETAIPMREDVRAACELLGLDPLHVANEGKLVAFVPEAGAEAALEAVRREPLGREAAIIGRVTAEHPGRVLMRTRIGGSRIVDTPAGEQLPRIC